MCSMAWRRCCSQTGTAARLWAPGTPLLPPAPAPLCPGPRLSAVRHVTRPAACRCRCAGVEVLRKVGKQLSPLRVLYAAFRGRCPYTAEALERFVEVCCTCVYVWRGAVLCWCMPCCLAVSRRSRACGCPCLPTALAHALARALMRPSQIWDMFVRCSDASLGFEDRFAIFCDQVGAGTRLLEQGRRRLTLGWAGRRIAATGVPAAPRRPALLAGT